MKGNDYSVAVFHHFISQPASSCYSALLTLAAFLILSFARLHTFLFRTICYRFLSDFTIIVSLNKSFGRMCVTLCQVVYCNVQISKIVMRACSHSASPLGRACICVSELNIFLSFWNIKAVRFASYWYYKMSAYSYRTYRVVALWKIYLTRYMFVLLFTSMFYNNLR